MPSLIYKGNNYSGGGGGTSYIELTQAQYNALSTAEKTNGTLYFITDADGSSGGSGSGSISVGFLAPTESTSTASKLYMAGDLLYYNDTLYRVTSSIASGSTIITSGASANVTETTVDNELKSKANVTAIDDVKIYKLTLTDVSYLPQSWSVWGNYLDLQVQDFQLTNDSAQLNDWQCSITEDEIGGGVGTVFTITGNITGSTDIILTLCKPEVLSIFDDNYGDNPEIPIGDNPIILDP